MSSNTAASSERTLKLRFHGRIIDSLGIQMYQSPTAAIAELIANAWDADAGWVDVTLPDDLSKSAEIVVGWTAPRFNRTGGIAAKA